MSNQAQLVLLDPATTPAPESDRSDRSSRRPIFIVDADARSRSVVGACLASLRLTNPTVELTDGDETMEALRQGVGLGPQHLPALVVLDLAVPGCSGLQILRSMHESSHLREIPVIILSADDGAARVTEAYRLGVRSYLIKPTGFDALGFVVRDLHLPWSLT